MKKNFFHGISLVPKSFVRKGVWMIFLLTIGSLLDLFSLASFIPLIILVINPRQTVDSKVFSTLSEITNFDNPTHFAIALTLATLTLIIIKTQINIWITYKKALYSYSVANDFASRAITKYMQISYQQFSQTDYTREMNRISNLPIVYANNYLIPLGTILSESLILCLLLVGVTMYNLNVALFIMAIIVPVGLLYRAKRMQLRNLGREIKKTYPLLLKYTLQAIEGLPEIRVFKKETFFKGRFKKNFEELAITFSKDHTALTSSVRLTELVAALCISVLILYTLLSRQSLEKSILLLGIYAGASFRAIPSVNRILAASLQIRTHDYIIPELDQMMAPQDIPFVPNTVKLPFDNELELCDISFKYDGQPWVLKNASLRIRKGEKVAIFGKSGSGKTTLFLLMMRFLKEQEGKIKIDGTILDESNSPGWEKQIGYVSQNPFILDESLIENVAFGIPKESIDETKVVGLLRSLGLEEWMNSLPSKLNTVIGERGAKLSGGQRQRLAIARALYHDAEILLLDEVTNQLDRETEQDVIEMLQKLNSLNKTVVLITHRRELWKFFDSIYELRNKTIQKMHRHEFDPIYP